MWEYVKKSYALLSPEDRRRWLRVLPLILATSASEAIGAAAVFALVASIADPAAVDKIPWIGETLATFGGDDPKRIGFALLVAIGVFYLLKSGVVVATEYAQAIASSRTAANLSSRLLTGYLRAPYIFHLRKNAADLVHTTTELAGSSFGIVVAAMIHTAAEVLVMLAILSVLLLVAPGVTLLASVVLLAVGGLLTTWLRRYSVHLGREARNVNASSMRQQTQALSVIDEITVLGRTDYFARQFSDIAERRAGVLARQQLAQALPRVSVETLFICGVLTVTIALLVTGASNARTISLLGLFAYAGFRIIPSANRILYQSHVIRFGQAAIDRILEDLDELAALSPSTAATREETCRFTQRIELSGVSLDYGAGAPAVLHDVTLAIERSRSVAIVGATGSGKSSLVRLLVGLLAPTRGEVSIDGVALPLVLRSWRRQLGYVPQEVHLIDDTLRRNIALGIADAEIDEDAVADCVRRAQLPRFIDSLPEGLDTRVGDRGVRLSGGERQRVGIARALYHRPVALILDEATSALDPQTEAAVLDALRADLRGATLIAVTHRLHAVRGFDQVAFMEDGHLRGLGTYDELSDELPNFRQLAAHRPVDA